MHDEDLAGLRGSNCMPASFPNTGWHAGAEPIHGRPAGPYGAAKEARPVTSCAAKALAWSHHVSHVLQRSSLTSVPRVA